MQHLRPGRFGVGDMAQAVSTSRLIARVPNLLSILRIGLAAFFPFCPGTWRLSVVVAGALSDFLDGQIARRYRVTTTKGGLLDAIADKLFAGAVLVTLSLDDFLFWWQAAMVLARDFTIGGVATYAALTRQWSSFRRMTPRPLGRATTVAQFVLFCLLLLTRQYPDVLSWQLVGAVILWLAAGLSLLAAGDYLLHLLRKVRERH